MIPTGLERWLPASVMVGGRAPASLVVRDATISGTHLEVRWTGRGWVARDQGKPNGTWIDGKRLPPGEARALRVGSVVALAKVQRALELLDDEPPVPFAQHVVTGEQRPEGDLGIELPHGLVRCDPELGWVLIRDGLAPTPVAPDPSAPEPAVITGSWRLENLEVRAEDTVPWLHRPLAAARIVLHYDVKQQQTGMTLEWDDGDHVKLPAKAEIYLFMCLVRELRTGKSRVLTTRIHERTGVPPESIPTYTSRLRRALRAHAVMGWESIVLAGDGFLHTGVSLDRIVEVRA